MATSRTTLTEPGRLILGLMIFTMAFSLVGEVITENSGAKPTGSPFTILFGGTVATSALTLLSHAGEAGEKFAVGLATIAFSTSALVYGGPVWTRLNQAFGSKPTGSLGTTSPTTSTTAATPVTIAAEQTVPLAATAAIAA
jgi:hypothetical protein